MIDYRRLNAEAMRLAIRVHRELGTPMDRQIDVYEAITRAGLPIWFQRLKDLSGAYLPAGEDTGGNPGIIINSQHPRSRQRFSAAHELGHHFHDGQRAEDLETEIFARRGAAPANPREAFVEAFASWFLMPRPLVTRLLKDRGIEGQPNPEQVYQLSLQLGTSFQATANQLAALRIIDRDGLLRLRATTPKSIKQQIQIHGPEDSRGDVWRIRRGESTVVVPQPGDEVIIQVDETPSSGYIWEPKQVPRNVELVETHFDPRRLHTRGEHTAVGGTGVRTFVLRARHPGAAELEFVKKHPWEKNGVVDSFNVAIAVEERQHAEAQLEPA